MSVVVQAVQQTAVLCSQDKPPHPQGWNHNGLKPGDLSVSNRRSLNKLLSIMDDPPPRHTYSDGGLIQLRCHKEC